MLWSSRSCFRRYIPRSFYNSFVIETISSDYKKFYATDKLIAWSRVLLEELIVAQIYKKLPAFYETWRFITLFTGPYPDTPHKSSPHPHSLCLFKIFLILSSHLRLDLPSVLFPSGVLTIVALAYVVLISHMRATLSTNHSHLLCVIKFCEKYILFSRNFQNSINKMKILYHNLAHIGEIYRRRKNFPTAELTDLSKSCRWSTTLPI